MAKDRKLGRPTDQRMAILKNLTTDLLVYERIETTDARAKEVRSLVENLIALGIKEKVLVLHIGGNTFGKDNSIRRFINNYNKLPNYLRESIVIENDDKVFNVSDCIKISKEIGTPIVLDYHHHNCNKCDFNIEDVIDSWGERVPKMHFSSPKNKKDYRSHSEYVSSDEFISFIDILKKYDRSVDIMIEAKAEDDALFRLVRELKYKTGYKFIDDTSFEV